MVPIKHKTWYGILLMRSFIKIVLIIGSTKQMELCFGEHFIGVKLVRVIFFDLGTNEHVNSTVYRDQILLGPLQDFWLESFCDVDPIVVEDNAPVHKKVCIPVRQSLGMECWQHHPNSPDLNPIENIGHLIKHIVTTEYSHITSESELQLAVNHIWDSFDNDQFNYLIESMPERLQAVVDAKGGSTKW